MLPQRSTYENIPSYSAVCPADIPADSARGEKLDPEAGTAESSSKSENTAKSAV